MTFWAAWFIAANRRLSAATEARLPQTFRRHLHTLYKFTIAEHLNRHQGQVVLDIGGGKDCPFLPYLETPDLHFISAVDFSEEELRRNLHIESRVVADAASSTFPFRDSSVHVIASRSVVEHLHDVSAFFANCRRVLRPGGVMIHTFPCKFSPFSIINQFIPNWVARRLLRQFHPQWNDICGFPAFYDRCFYSSIRRLLEEQGFVNAKFTFRWYQSIYYDFFFPLYLVMLAYDLLIASLGIRNLACQILLTAERRAD